MLGTGDWDGVLVDCLESNPHWMVSGGNNRSIDPDRSNTPTPGDPSESYAVFDAAWNAGGVAYGEALRAGAPDAVFIGNGNMLNYAMNGNVFEEFPNAGTPLASWQTAIVGPYDSSRASYLDWCANAYQPPVTLIQGYGASDNYQLMRYTLCTALMGDGSYAYDLSSSGHARNGLYWFDEYDNAGVGQGYLGQPVGKARQGSLTTPDLLLGDGLFATPAQFAAWEFASAGDVVGSAALDSGAARITVTVDGQSYDGEFIHPVDVVADTSYTVSFTARCTMERVVSVYLHPTSDAVDALEEKQYISIGEDVRRFMLTFTPTSGDIPAYIRFALGAEIDTVWIDDVRVQEGPAPAVYQRDYEYGTVLVNPDSVPHDVPLDSTYYRISGAQDSSVNSGAAVTSVSVPPLDGVILLSQPTESGTAWNTRGVSDSAWNSRPPSSSLWMKGT